MFEKEAVIARASGSQTLVSMRITWNVLNRHSLILPQDFLFQCIYNKFLGISSKLCWYVGTTL
jgi:hypothetical protein